MLNSMSPEVLTSEYCKNTFLIQPFSVDKIVARRI